MKMLKMPYVPGDYSLNNFKSGLTGYLTEVVRHTTQLIGNCVFVQSLC